MKNRLLFLALISIILCGCSPEKAESQSISVVNWNLQTFFDGTNDGIEYSEFRKNSAWGTEAYTARLLKLCSAIKLMNADIYVFEEMENSRIIYDISNQLAGQNWNGKTAWNYACFSKNPQDSIGCAVISRLPILKNSIHNLDIRTENQQQPSMRPVMKVEILCGSQILSLFVNHWKSKSSGEEESHVWRDWQESQLCRMMIEREDSPALACGDLNQDISEFSFIKWNSEEANQKANVLLREKLPLEKQEKRDADVFSPWILENGSLAAPGSYFYQDKWERIDHFFANRRIAVGDFYAVENELWCGENGAPKGYKIYSGTGWSDHLPIHCRIRIK